MSICELHVAIELLGPFVTQSSVAGAYGVDVSAAVNSSGRLMLPYSLVKGRLRDAWCELNALNAWPPDISPPDIDVLCGSENRGLLQFEDLVADAGRSLEARIRVSIDAATGTARRGSVWVAETPPSGSRIRFCGVARVLSAKFDVAMLARQVEIGLRWAGNLGALHGIGFGRVADASVTVALIVDVIPKAFSDDAVQHVTLSFSEPFCVSRPQPVANYFESDEVIPGGVLKGAIAMRIRHDEHLPQDCALDVLAENRVANSLQALVRNFEHVRILHAWPVRDAAADRPVPVPFSTALAPEVAAPVDLALSSKHVLISSRAVSFRPDWKDAAAVEAAVGIVHPDAEIRVRTAIDGKTRAAADEKLFSQRLILPKESILSQNETDGAPELLAHPLVWATSIDLTSIHDSDDRRAAASALSKLLADGLPGIGKTKAFAAASMHPSRQAAPVAPQRDIGDGLLGWVLVLRSQTILCDPHEYRDDGATQAYESAIQQLRGSLTLVRVFARESLAGGEWLARKFQAGTSAYEPYLLSEPGTVLVVRAADKSSVPAAQKTVEEWRTKGIPFPTWAIHRFARNGHAGNHWTNCPYVPSNGYGEVAVNLPQHWDWHPAHLRLEFEEFV